MNIRWEKIGEEPVYVGFRSLVRKTFEKARRREGEKARRRKVARSETGHS
ncbi:MAG: hypothetical protein U9R05_10600 [Chloroflexota bacterium]|nr:hypothetical protein [Chloroflexota bacterium]